MISLTDDEMVTAWRHAGSQLGIRVVAPHTVELPEGETVIVEALIPDFGGPSGALAVALADEERCELARRTARFVSELGPMYRTFDLDLFRDALNDWGWFGSDRDRPRWYTGKPWT